MRYFPRCFFHNYKINLLYNFPQDGSIFIELSKAYFE